tara:strand:- start:915 stop:1517 length:603 start_codon:yes stop_codon:yes gene_type:complete
MFAGMHDEDDDYGDEPFDLSGWMSRSPPADGGLGNSHYEEPPMIEEPTIRERVRTRTRSNAQTSAQFTPPMPEVSGIHGTPKFIKAESPFNPLWVADDALFPKATQALKLVGFGSFIIGSTLYGAGLLAHSRATSQTQDMLDFSAPIAKSLAAAGFFGYLHPVLGLGKGLMPFDGWKFKTLTVGTHALGLLAANYVRKRV